MTQKAEAARPRWWLRIVSGCAIFSTLVALMANLSTIASFIQSLGGPPGISSVESSVATAVPSLSPAPPPATALSQCVDKEGRKSPCSASASGSRVEAMACETDAALRSLGVDPEMRQVDVIAAIVSGECYLFPGPVATLSGATALDIERLAEGATVSTLSLCRIGGAGGNEVACSQAHSMEYVGPWKELSGEAAADAECLRVAKTYTGRGLGEPSEPLKVRRLAAVNGGVDVFRCVVAASDTQLLHESVWQIGGRQPK